jgi:parallel beta-helix repeat protein
MKPKRALWLSLVCLAVVTACVALFILLPDFWYRLRVIRVKEDSPTVQEAINKARDGDTIRVSVGTYYEHLIVNKTVSLVGEDNDNTIIDGTNNGTIVEITAEGVVVTGFKIQNSGYGWNRNGIYVNGANNCEIMNNHLQNVCHNIKVNNSSNSQVSDNQIDGTMMQPTMYGIRIESSTNCTVIKNNVTDCVGALHLENSSGCVVSHNIVAQNDQGIRLYTPCTDNVIGANTFFNNNYEGIIAPMPTNTTLTNNKIYHNNFVNNTQPFRVQIGGTSWDNGYEGNYWSHYAGKDANQDGIGDEVYAVGSDQDNYPLMGNYTEASIGLQEMMSTIGVVSNSSTTVPYLDSSSCNQKIVLSTKTYSQDSGFCRIIMPPNTMSDQIALLIDNKAYNFTKQQVHENTRQERIMLYFVFPNGPHAVTIISASPQFCPFQILLLLSAIAGLATLVIFSTSRILKKNRDRRKIEKRVRFCHRTLYNKL